MIANRFEGVLSISLLLCVAAGSSPARVADRSASVILSEIRAVPAASIPRQKAMRRKLRIAPMVDGLVGLAAGPAC
jgi:hypothetical protein